MNFADENQNYIDKFEHLLKLYCVEGSSNFFFFF
jgi:hypothetical protein